MFKSVERSITLTDHKLLMYLLKSSAFGGIFVRWALKLRCLGVDTRWIVGSWNVVAGALSRTIFPDAEYDAPTLEEFGESLQEEGKDPIWVWKDGK